MKGIIPSPYDATKRLMVASLKRNLLPDALLRRLCRMLLADHLRSGYKATAELQLYDLLRFVKALREMPIAIAMNREKPKGQNVGPPTSFFKLVLGDQLKNSCCYFSDKSTSLEDASEAMLKLYCERSKLEDGHTVLDLGCGWGTLTLYIAQKYKNCKITGITYSVNEKAYIDEQCRILGLENVEIFAADISSFEMEALSFDRIISIGMFEALKNYADLLKKLSMWMKEDALLFVEHYCHKVLAYNFEETYEHDWISKTFFKGVTMPSANLLLYFQEDVSVVDQWLFNGKHYAQTFEEWVKGMDKNSASIKPILETTYGKDEAEKWFAHWRTFFIAYAELFGYNNGEEWMVTHLLFKKK